MLKWSFIWLIKAYRYGISPLLGPRCRFTPTCSEYAIQALQSHGIIRGSFITTKRIMRCHPYCEGGYDPVPACDTCQKHRKESIQNTNSSKLRD